MLKHNAYVMPQTNTSLFWGITRAVVLLRSYWLSGSRCFLQTALALSAPAGSVTSAEGKGLVLKVWHSCYPRSGGASNCSVMLLRAPVRGWRTPSDLVLPKEDPDCGCWHRTQCKTKCKWVPSGGLPWKRWCHPNWTQPYHKPWLGFVCYGGNQTMNLPWNEPNNSFNVKLLKMWNLTKDFK